MHKHHDTVCSDVPTRLHLFQSKLVKLS